MRLNFKLFLPFLPLWRPAPVLSCAREASGAPRVVVLQSPPSCHRPPVPLFCCAQRRVFSCVQRRVAVPDPLLFLSCMWAWHGVAVDGGVVVVSALGGVVVDALGLLLLPFLLLLEC